MILNYCRAIQTRCQVNNESQILSWEGNTTYGVTLQTHRKKDIQKLTHRAALLTDRPKIGRKKILII